LAVAADSKSRRAAAEAHSREQIVDLMAHSPEHVAMQHMVHAGVARSESHRLKTQ
jgi:hypothetical protein